MIIRIVGQDQFVDAVVDKGVNLMTALRMQGFTVTAPCGGQGTCGKCLVEIDGQGPVLACQTIIGKDRKGSAGKDHDGDPDLVVRLPSQAKVLILINGLMPHLSINPLVQFLTVTVPQPTSGNRQADDDRFTMASGYKVPFELLAQLPEVLAKSAGLVHFIGRLDTHSVMRFLPTSTDNQVSDTEKSALHPDHLTGVAIDIGTTTLAAYLYDLRDGQRLASTAMINPQTEFGADVISRIAKASNNAADLEELQTMILQAVTKLCSQLLILAEKTHGLSIQLNDLALITLAGNTTMMHLLTGLPPQNIALAPFNPVTNSFRILTGAELKLTAFPQALCILLPSISGYVGADITAGIMALGLGEPHQETALLIDIGTNGEIVLQTGDHMTACSTAAGPAFEGADISCGMSGIAGAIDHIWVSGNDLSYSVISSIPESENSCDTAKDEDFEKPEGLCGSGLIDAVAVMIETGVIDETGKIGVDEHLLPEPIRRRLMNVNNQPAFILAFAAETVHGKTILLTQKDIQELQLAKAAIASGIRLLLQKEGIAPATVRTVYLAGGFGQYLNVHSARKIGLLPGELAGHIVSAGNTSAMGAIGALLDWSFAERSQATAHSVVYRELSSDPAFSDLFLDALMFPERQS